MPTFEELVETLKSWFIYPYTDGDYILYGILFALAFGAVWLLAHWPPLRSKPWILAVGAVGGFLTLLAFVFIEIPLREGIREIMLNIWDGWTLQDWLLLSTIPFVLVIGLVQEGAKMVPMVFWWAKSGRKISPKMGLAIGALAGAGFGVFQAVWMHNSISPVLGMPWEAWEAAQHGFEGIALYWESFFYVGFHIAVSAIAGYGLARGKGIQFYLLAAFLHAAISYVSILQARFDLSVVEKETIIAVITVLVTAGILMYRWRRTDDEPEEPVELSEPIEPVESPDPYEPIKKED